jgi:hypothetical protein
MPTLDGLRSSAFLRCSNAEPEEKVAHRAICFLAEFGMMLSEALFGPPTLMIRRRLSQKEAKRLFAKFDRRTAL